MLSRRYCRHILCGSLSFRRGHAIDSAAFSVLPKPRLSYRDIVDNAVYKSHNAFNRKAYLPMGAIQSIAKVWREHKDVCAQLDLKRYERNVVGEKFRNFFSGAGDQQAQDEAVEAAKEIKRIIADLEVTKVELEEKLLGLALAIPNDTHPLSPIGPDAAALTLSTHGPDPIPASPERDHVNVGRSLDLFDFESGAVSTGSSWYYLKNEGALLEMALTNYALSTAIQNGFTPFTTPDVVRADIAARCGFRPRDQPDSPTSQVYHIVTDTTLSHPSVRPEFLLAGTAEIPLAALFANKIIHTDSLPAKVVGVGKAFRAEAGARGTDARGLYRVHQFTKVELFAVTQEGASEEMMEEIRRVQVQLFEGLGIPFRVRDMPTEDLGASAFRKYDMEAWMPGRAKWGEISSTSNCTDYQSRRLHIRYRPLIPPSNPPSPSTSTAKSISFAHTLNGTAAAIPRLIVALLENGARFDAEGNAIGLDLPRVLERYWVGRQDIIRWV